MSIFKKAAPTVAAALQGFHKAIAELKAVKEHHDAEAGKHEGIIGAGAYTASLLVAGGIGFAAGALFATWVFLRYKKNKK